MNPRALPPPARRALTVLRAGLGYPPLSPGRPGPAGDGDLLAYLTATGLGPAYRKAIGKEETGHAAPFLDALDALWHGALARNMVHFAELGRILDAASGRGIDVLAMKGVPAIVFIYGGDIAMRPMADLDLLVRPKDIRPFIALIEALGYARAKMPIDPFVGERGRHLPPLFHPRRGATVEVHRAADYRFEFIGAPLLPAFFDTARRGTVDGRPVLFPSWEAWIFQWAVHLVYTDAYAGKMRDLYDMAVCLESFRDEVDWAYVVHPARTDYLLRPLWMGLLLVERVFGPAVPAPWRARLRRRAGMDYPVRELPEWLIRGSLFGESLHRILPLSVLAALSMPLHVPSLTPRLIGEFLRTFVTPPIAALEAQYGFRRGVVNTPLLYLLRSAHLASVIANRVAGKLLRRGGS